VQQIGADEVRFGQASGNVHAVRLFVVEADPFLEIAQHLEGVVSELVATIIVYAVATELDTQKNVSIFGRGGYAKHG
jgi:hypothetical protein